MLFYEGKSTKLQSGDLVVVDTDDQMVRLKRGDVVLQDESGGEKEYWLMPEDGVQIETIAELLADSCGLGFEEVRDEEYPTFRFVAAR